MCANQFGTMQTHRVAAATKAQLQSLRLSIRSPMIISTIMSKLGRATEAYLPFVRIQPSQSEGHRCGQTKREQDFRERPGCWVVKSMANR